MKKIDVRRVTLVSFIVACMMSSCTIIRQNYSYPTLSDNYTRKAGISHSTRHKWINNNHGQLKDKIHSMDTPGKDLQKTGSETSAIPATLKSYGYNELNIRSSALKGILTRGKCAKDLVIPIPALKEEKVKPIAAISIDKNLSGQILRTLGKLTLYQGNKQIGKEDSPERKAKSGPGFGIASLMAAVIALGTLLTGGFGVSLICCLLAVIFGLIGLNKKGNGLAIAGLVIGILELLLIAIAIVAFVSFMTGLSGL